MLLTRDVEFRADTRSATENDGRTLSGYAAVFDQDTEINSWEGKFTERIAKGAFKKTLQGGRKPIMQYDHGHDSRVGSVPIGVYTEIREDDKGLYVEGRLFDNDLVEPVRQAIEGKAISGMSFKFKVIRDEWRDEEGKILRGDKLKKRLWNGMDGLQRTIKEVQLFEAGPVATPAYSGTSVGVRSADEVTPEQRDELFAMYDRTAQSPADTEERNADNDDVERWLEAEKVWRWIEAENEYRNACEQWLEAEKTYLESDAARKGTSEGQENPEDDAVRQDTSRGEPKKDKPNTRKTRMAYTLKELRELLADAEARVAAVDDNEEYRDAELPEDVEKAYTAAKAEADDFRGRIEKVEARLEAMKGSKNVEDGRQKKGDTKVRKAENIFDLDEIRKLAYDRDDHVKLVRDHAKRAIDETDFGGTAEVDESRAKESALKILSRFDDENNVLANRYLVTGSDVYQRAWAKAAAAGTAQVLLGEEARALSLGSDGAGGYAVPFQLDPTVIWTMEGIQDPIRANARVIQITGKEYHGVKGDAASVTRAPEAAEVGDHSFSLTNFTVRTNRVHGFIPFSYELAESWDAVRREITYALNWAKVEEEAVSFLLGDGTGVNANGLIKTLSGNTVDTASASAFAVGDLYTLEESLDVRYRSNAKFLAHHSTYNAIRQFGTTDGHALWERIGNGQPNQLLGYSALESSVVAGTPNPGTAADWAPSKTAATQGKFMLFGDFRNFLIVDRIGMSVELIPQVFGTANNRPTGQRGIYAIWMNNTKVVVDSAFKVLKYKAA